MNDTGITTIKASNSSKPRASLNTGNGCRGYAVTAASLSAPHSGTWNSPPTPPIPNPTIWRI